MGALSVLSLNSNSLGPDGGKALAEGLKGNTVITKLDISSNDLSVDSDCLEPDMSGVIALANVLPDMRALSKLIFGGDPDRVDNDYEPAILEVGMTEADLSEKDLGVGGAIIISAWLTHKDNGAISSANLLSNNIGTEQAHILASILKEHPTLKSLCGNQGDEMELDMSGKKIGTEGAIMLAPEIINNGAVSIVNAMGNKIGKEQLDKLQEIMRSKPNLVSLCGIADDATEADLSGLRMDDDDAVVLASELPDKGAMTSLNLASNRLGPKGAKIVAEAIKVTMWSPAIIMAPFSCPSGFSVNCCCLLLSAGYGGNVKFHLW
jgi:hypothetical protein